MKTKILEISDPRLAKYVKVVLEAMGFKEVKPNEFEEMPKKKPTHKTKAPTAKMKPE